MNRFPGENREVELPSGHGSHNPHNTMIPRSEIYVNIAASCRFSYGQSSAKITAPIWHSTGYFKMYLLRRDPEAVLQQGKVEDEARKTFCFKGE